MKKFLTDIFLCFIIIVLVGELLVRGLFLYDNPIKRENLNGNYLPIPHQEGKNIKGKFKEINADYSINNEGFNSAIDYSPELLKNKTTIAIVGDSFVEGTHVNIENSIGRLVERELPNSVVFEYGVSETNICDYESIYKQYGLENFDFVFVIFSFSDLYGFKPDSMGTEEKGSSLKNSFFRKFYNQSHFISYLNFNHAIFRGFKAAFFNGSPTNSDEVKLNTAFLDKKPQNVIALYNKLEGDKNLDDHTNFQYKSIIHTKEPYTFGFDKHWNANGRINVAKTILNIISDESSERFKEISQ